MVSPFERFPRQTRGSLPPDIGTDDDEAIAREVSRIRAREQLEQAAQQIGGPGTRVADPNLFQRFLATAGEQYQRINQASQSFLPSNQEIVGELKKIGAGLLESPIPEAFVTRAPAPLQPAARVIRESASPLAAATLPLGGSPRVVVGGLLGAAGGATAGQAVGGDVGELVGAVGGGIASGIPAVQRLAGRGIVRAGDEAALRLQGRQVAHAATDEARGRWFSSNPQKSFGFASRQNGILVYVDVPTDIAHSAGAEAGRIQNRPTWINHILPEQYRQRAIPYWRAGSGSIQGAIDSLPPVPEGHTRLFRGMSQEEAASLSGGKLLPAHAATGDERLSKEAAEAAFTRTRAAEAGGVPPRGPQAAAVETPDEPVSRLVGAIQNVKRLSPQLRSELAEKRRLELGTRVGVGMERAAGVSPSQKARALRSALSGELPRIPALEPVRGQFSPDDVETLYGRIWSSSLRDLEKGNASDALVRVLLPEGLDVPTPSEMTLLERVFGPEMRRALEEISKGRARKAWEATVDVLNISRALKSSWDISAMFRQGAILSISHPQKAFGGRNSATVRMLRAFRSPQAHEESLTRIRSDPDFDLIAGTGAGRKNPLFIADAAETKITAREEAFASRWASRIPGIKGSQRAFNTYLNEMKWKTAKAYVDGLRAEGVNVTPDSKGLDTMTRFLNVSTGRGKLGVLEPRQGRDTAARTRQLILEMATTVFWSPRLTVSRFQVPVEGLRAVANLKSADPALRAASKQIAGDLVKYTGAVLSFLTFLKLSNLAEVEVDPRSSDFGKIRVGGIRVDAWAGFQPPLRYTAQWITGQSKPITTGGIQDVPRDRVFGKFLRSKLSPGAVELAATFLPKDTPLSGLSGGGRTFIGERIVPGPAKPYKTVPDRTKNLYGELLDAFAVPLIYEDINEAIRAEGLVPGMIFGAAPLVGFGVTTIPEDEQPGNVPRNVPAGALR